MWLVRDGEVLAAAEVACDARARRKGLVGRDSFEGALVLRPCRQVHTFGMRFAIDVAFCDVSGVVLRIATISPRRMSAPVWRAAFALEAPEGAFERWGLRAGDRVELRG
jgi:uncharacterized membrane protein (UPF0127 family)